MSEWANEQIPSPETCTQSSDRLNIFFKLSIGQMLNVNQFFFYLSLMFKQILINKT